MNKDEPKERKQDIQQIDFTTKYIIVGKNVIPVLDLGINENGKRGFVDVRCIYTSKSKVFNNKKDALYAKLIENLSNGESFSNYKRSKYYKYYSNRLKNDNPEFLI